MKNTKKRNLAVIEEGIKSMSRLQEDKREKMKIQ